jgi:class 3 adenylate cyclase
MSAPTATEELVRAWADAGLYDPGAPNADDRRALLHWLHELGTSLDEMVAAHARGTLTSVAGDSLLRPMPTWTLRDIAEQLATDVSTLDRLRRASGFPPIDPDERSFDDGDLVLFRSFLQASSFFSAGELLHLTRVIGASMRRIADAASEMFFIDVEAPLRSVAGGELALAKKNLEAMQLTRAAIAVFEPLFRAHLQESLHTSRTARRDAAELGTVPLAIGFVDLSGYTSMVERISATDLLSAVLGFESAAYDLVAERGGRVVKMIGDEVMYTTVDVASACDIALGLLDTLGAHETVRARGGVSFGNVIAHGGDLYGVSVNRASRMADIAIPDEVLVDADVVSRAGVHRFEPAGRRQLKGFRQPVPVWSLVSPRTGPDTRPGG